ncbi:hypothetical protein B0H19DRAFT_111485 [Mycena capillaripes]|nr:hypothetical protein B0H19DRAFT_111485 [Mycena capillaripes]
MLFFRLALLALSVSAAFLYSERDIEPAEDDLMQITVDLANIDTELFFFSAGNINAAIVLPSAAVAVPCRADTSLSSPEHRPAIWACISIHAQRVLPHFGALIDFYCHHSPVGTQTPQLCVSQNGPATPGDADGFIKMAESGYIPVILDVLNKTTAARAAFAATDDFVPVILKDLLAYNASNSIYLSNLTFGAPPEFLPLALNITRNITTAFSKAIAAYSD